MLNREKKSLVDLIEIQIFVNGLKVVEHNNKNHTSLRLDILDEKDGTKNVIHQTDKLLHGLKGYLVGITRETSLKVHLDRQNKQLL